MTHVVGRQKRGGLNFKIQQVADRVLVLGSIQAVEGRPAWIRIESGNAIDVGLQRRGEFHEGVVFRPRHAGRRHHSGSQLEDDFLRLFCVLIRIREVDVAVEREAPVPHVVVVAVATVLLDQCHSPGDCHRLGGWRRRRCRARSVPGQQHRVRPIPVTPTLGSRFVQGSTPRTGRQERRRIFSSSVFTTGSEGLTTDHPRIPPSRTSERAAVISTNTAKTSKLREISRTWRDYRMAAALFAIKLLGGRRDYRAQLGASISIEVSWIRSPSAV